MLPTSDFLSHLHSDQHTLLLSEMMTLSIKTSVNSHSQKFHPSHIVLYEIHFTAYSPSNTIDRRNNVPGNHFEL